ncbi:MAG: tetratricopeptide repeat protein, partial [Candidatus Bipolaricaulia bacterium]
MIRKSVLLFFCLYVVCGAVVAFAETLHVPEDYPTIQAAIDVAQPGDTVRVGPGRYRENLTIGKPLQLVGEERAAVLIHPDDSTLAAVQVVIDEAEVRIEAISVLGGATGIRVHVDNGSRAVIRDVACGYSDVGIYATGDGIVLVQDCVVFETEMICLIAAAREMDIRDNEVFDGETGVLLAGDASCMVENNLIALIDYAVDTYTLSCGWSEGLARFSGDVAGAGNRVHGMVTDLCPPSPTALWPTRFVDDGWASEIDQALRVLVVAADTYEEGGLAQALQGCEEGLALLARADFPAQEAAALGIMGNILGDLGRYEDALEAYARARLVYAVRSAEISVAELDVNEGNASISLGWFDTALAAYQRARGVFSLWGREDDVARTLIGTGVVHSERGDFAVALTAFESAREIYERLADPLDLAGLNNNFGTLYTALERYEEAVEALSAARWVYAARGMELEVAIVDMNLGTAHHELGDYEQALTCYASAREVFETREMDADVAGIENNVGTVYQDLGLYEDALGAYSFARDIYSSLGMAVHVARVNVNVGLLRFDLGRYEKALDAYEQALSVFAAAGMEVDLADVSHNMAIVLSVLDRYEEALDAYELALILYANSDLRISAAQVERNIGALCLGLDFYDEALVSLQSARGVFSESGMALEVARTDGNIGLAYLHQGFVEDARRTFEGALALLDHLQLSAEGTLVNPPFRWQLHYNLGLTLEELTEEEAALIAYEGAIAVIESIRGALTIEELKLAWQEQTKDVYER